ncbi:hypothetical protein MKJ01_18740 [Chryseobacterium sp. SSA4.19]|uniref:hypothetical protein n=1 Tax=Chryseobacterium sp. SSA4.19 TaxID=2919915 RepID=UPI001F4D9526|nr:hypothetical protein [Chryseobacterium sp. SSA4.19]MCJ8155789.1 hypothetical protein [Chryseobacterium sp. SSA4.19]
MRIVSVLICCLFFGFSFSQHIDGVWINEELRSSILDGSLELKDTELLTPMFFEISKGKVTHFYQVESSVKPRFKSLKKITKGTYTDGLALYALVNENTISYKTKKKNITFIRNLNRNRNDLFDTKKSLTKNYIKFSKLSRIKDAKSNKEFNVKCVNDGNGIRCVYDQHQFSYTIYSSNPYHYNKRWNKLKFYMNINIDNTVRTYLLEKQTNNSYHLKDLITDKVEYILK